MRCWHKSLIPVLPRQQLLGQWRECCLIAKSIAEKGIPNHILVNRIMDYPLEQFKSFCDLVCIEMESRGYRCDFSRLENWMYKIQPEYDYVRCEDIFLDWHNDTYLRQCLYNLEEKAICGGISTEEWESIYQAFKDFTPLWKG